MEKLEQMYEGKAKKVFSCSDPNLCIVSYKDDATAFNGKKKGTIVGKGIVNNKMSNYLMSLLEKEGVPTHFVEELSDRDTLVRRVRIVPLEVIVRNVAAGSFSKRFGVAEGTKLLAPTLEFCYKCDDFYHPNDEGGLAWNDPAIGIEWPELTGTYNGSASGEDYALSDGTKLNLSDKDQLWDTLENTFKFD